MTTTIPDNAPVTTAADWELAERVSRHMQTVFPDTEAAASWVVARDERDNTAVVVAQPGYDHTLPGGCRAMHLFRWHTSLQYAGFTSEPRTDMEVFGRPEEQSHDGRARWLHITGWDEARIIPYRTVPELVRELKRKIGTLPQHHVRLRPADNPPMDDVQRKGIRPDLAVFTYHDDGKYGGMDVDVYANQTGYPVAVGNVPAWLWAIGEAHRDHADNLSWCYPDSEKEAS